MLLPVVVSIAWAPYPDEDPSTEETIFKISSPAAGVQACLTGLGFVEFQYQSSCAPVVAFSTAAHTVVDRGDSDIEIGVPPSNALSTLSLLIGVVPLRYELRVPPPPGAVVDTGLAPRTGVP